MMRIEVYTDIGGQPLCIFSRLQPPVEPLQVLADDHHLAPRLKRQGRDRILERPERFKIPGLLLGTSSTKADDAIRRALQAQPNGQVIRNANPPAQVAPFHQIHVSELLGGGHPWHPTEHLVVISYGDAAARFGLKGQEAGILFPREDATHDAHPEQAFPHRRYDLVPRLNRLNRTGTTGGFYLCAWWKTLVVVGHDGEIPVPRGQELHQLELGAVSVLELVHQDGLEAPLVALEDVRPGAEEAERVHDLIAEIGAPLPSQQLLVLRVGPGQLPLPGPPVAELLVIRARGGLGPGARGAR